MTKKRAVVGAAVLAAGLLAGCSSHPGTAAVVNGKEVSEKSVDQLAREMNVDTEGQRPSVLNLALSAVIAQPVIDEFPELFTPEIQEQSLQQCSATAGLGEITEDSPEQIKTLCHALTLGQLDQDFAVALDEASTNAEVELSPRYATVTSNLPDYLTTTDRSLENVAPQENILGQ
ncbi:hypothetical protein VR010_00620 [Actinomycetaceae bacterium L2_0104]